jgi:hypothetical protein
MDFKDTPEQAQFREKCRSWLEANAELKVGHGRTVEGNLDE